MNKKLEELRKEIDAIDGELLMIINKRLNVVKKIGKLKKQSNSPILDKKRKSEILEFVNVKAKSLGIDESFIKKIFTLIHNYSAEAQKKL